MQNVGSPYSESIIIEMIVTLVCLCVIDKAANGEEECPNLLVSSSSSESSVFLITHPMSLTEKDEQTLGLVAKLRQKVYRDWWCKFYGFQKEVRFALNETAIFLGCFFDFGLLTAPLNCL